MFTGGETITLTEIQQMELTPLIHYAVPIMLSLVFLEYIISQWQKLDFYGTKDLWSAIGIGLGNLGVSAILKLGLFTVVLFCYNLVPWRIPHTWWSYILCLVVLDFCRYWAHRFAHEWRWLWATHVTHHSSEYYNFTLGFRLSWTQHVKLLFFLPVAFLGFHPVQFFIIHQAAVLYQFWIHTEYVRKLPRFIEYIFVTPSHHRVHHGRDPKYINTNYGSTFIIWDRMFGSFQPEEEQPDYGITRPPNSYNPVVLVFHEWVDIFRDISRARSFKDIVKILFGGVEDMRLTEREVAEKKRTPRDLATPLEQKQQGKKNTPSKEDNN